jgi:hydrogenase maturation protease
MGETPVIILGLGNTLMGDEGFGVHFVRWFEGRRRLPPEAEVVDGGTLGYVLLDTICRAKHVIVIDCLRLDDTPGSLYRFNRSEMEAHLPPPTSAHEVKFSDVLCKVEMMGECPEMTFLCVVPECIGDMVLEMTQTVRAKFPEMEALLLAELAAHNLVPERIGEDA